MDDNNTSSRCPSEFPCSNNLNSNSVHPPEKTTTTTSPAAPSIRTSPPVPVTTKTSATKPPNTPKTTVPPTTPHTSIDPMTSESTTTSSVATDGPSSSILIVSSTGTTLIDITPTSTPPSFNAVPLSSLSNPFSTEMNPSPVVPTAIDTLLFSTSFESTGSAGIPAQTQIMATTKTSQNHGSAIAGGIIGGLILLGIIIALLVYMKRRTRRVGENWAQAEYEASPSLRENGDSDWGHSGDHRAEVMADSERARIMKHHLSGYSTTTRATSELEYVEPDFGYGQRYYPEKVGYAV